MPMNELTKKLLLVAGVGNPDTAGQVPKHYQLLLTSIVNEIKMEGL